MNKYKTVDDIINGFEGTHITSGMAPGEIYSPYDLMPIEYIQFAKKDIATGALPYNLVNAVGNAKRAIECRLDATIDFWGMTVHAKRERWKFPDKLEFFESIGIIAPNILRKINKHRNQTEHDYACPELESVQDFVDIAELFIGYTDTFIRTEIDCEIEDTETQNSDFLQLEHKTGSSVFNLVVFEGGDKDTKPKRYDLAFALTENTKDYIKLIKWWYEHIMR